MKKLLGVYSKTEASELIGRCEEEFHASLSALAKEIVESDIKCFTLSGPTCSGKTTTSNYLTHYLEKMGTVAKVISIDDFYFSAVEMKARGLTDFEGPSAIDLKLISTVVEALAKGQKTVLPCFDFVKRDRFFDRTIIPESRDIYIFEGIQAIYPEVRAVIGAHFEFKSVFIDVSEGVIVGDTSFGTSELRLMRRTVRDFNHRGTSVAETMKLWKGVRANETKNILPFSDGCDYSISSTMPYEVFLIGKMFQKLTADYPVDEKLGDSVHLICEKLKVINGTEIDSSMVPHDSLLREFIA